MTSALLVFLNQMCIRDRAENAFSQRLDKYKDKFIAAMDDDINTADAISVIFEIVADANKEITAESNTSKSLILKVISAIRELGGVLGLLGKKTSASLPAEVEELLEKRAAARSSKNWAESDTCLLYTSRCV